MLAPGRSSVPPHAGPTTPAPSCGYAGHGGGQEEGPLPPNVREMVAFVPQQFSIAWERSTISLSPNSQQSWPPPPPSSSFPLPQSGPVLCPSYVSQTGWSGHEADALHTSLASAPPPPLWSVHGCVRVWMCEGVDVWVCAALKVSQMLLSPLTSSFSSNSGQVFLIWLRRATSCVAYPHIQ